MLVSYVFPYYFHIEPTVIVGGALGRFSYVVNEGILDVFWGPDGNFEGHARGRSHHRLLGLPPRDKLCAV